MILFWCYSVKMSVVLHVVNSLRQAVNTTNIAKPYKILGSNLYQILRVAEGIPEMTKSLTIEVLRCKASHRMF